jgi:catechol 2,3-dioxygenase
MSEILCSQLAHVELISPKPDETARWMVDVLGLEETTRVGQSVYLRGWGEWLHSSLVVTEGAEPGLGHIAWRGYGSGDPQTVADRLKDSELALGWVDDAVGHGPAFRFRAPHGKHVHEIFWDTDLYEAPTEKAEQQLPMRPQRYPARGAQARYIDHITVVTPNIRGDIEFYEKTLGHRNTAIVTGDSADIFGTTTCNAIRPTHNMGLAHDASGATRRMNHLAYRVEQRMDVERAAEVFVANGYPIEFGPGMHGIDEIVYLYVREPGGVRIEINAGGWENYMPDWNRKIWSPTQGANIRWRNLVSPESVRDAFPPVSDSERARGEMLAAGHIG